MRNNEPKSANFCGLFPLDPFVVILPPWWGC
jgi:hypothetical protein